MSCEAGRCQAIYETRRSGRQRLLAGKQIEESGGHCHDEWTGQAEIHRGEMRENVNIESGSAEG